MSTSLKPNLCSVHQKKVVCFLLKKKDVLNHGDGQHFIIFADPDFYPSRISDPKTATKGRGVAINFPKFKIILF
jgi:hypothetical protein